MNAMNIPLQFELDRDFPGRAWPVGDPVVSIGGHDVHLFALRVKPDVDPIEAWQDDFADEVRHACDINGARVASAPLDGLDGLWTILATEYGE